MVASAAEVRPEYVALADHLEFLCGAFGLACTRAHRADVAATLAAFECMDRHYDAVVDSKARCALGRRMVDAFAGDAPASSLPLELAGHVSALRGVFDGHGARAACRDFLSEFFIVTERTRTTRDPREYLRSVRREGFLTSAMVVLLLHDDDARFRSFFLQLGVVGNLVDKICDVRDDYARGEIAVPPSLEVHARLLAAFVISAAPLLVSFPRPIALTRWGLGYLRPALDDRSDVIGRARRGSGRLRGGLRA
jgi:hypothetical protein